MERLTYFECGKWVIKQGNVTIRARGIIETLAQQGLNRLAQYENTGLTPEEIVELKFRMEGLEK